MNNVQYDATKTLTASGGTIEDFTRTAIDDIATVDGVVDSILEDTGELQTNQGNWLTATGFAVAGDITTAHATTDTLIGNLASLGSGAISVDHDTGGTDNLAYKTGAGAGIDNAIVRAYLTADYDAGSRTDAFVKGATTTTTTGRWSGTMRLDAGAYTFEFSKQGSFGPDTKEQAVS